MALLTPAQAAARLGKTERTIRRWIEKEHKLEATKALHGHHKYLIDEQEVDRLAQELAQEQPIATSDQAQEQDTSSLLERVNQLEQRLDALVQAVHQNYFSKRSLIDILEEHEQKLAHIEHVPSVETPVLSATAGDDTRTRIARPIATTEPPEDIPEGSILHGEFAKLHTVSDTTLKGQIDRGDTPAIIIPRPGRKNEKSRWLTPVMQRQTLQFWTSNGNEWGWCTVASCPCHDYQQTRQQEQQDTSEPQPEQDQLNLTP